MFRVNFGPKKLCILCLYTIDILPNGGVDVGSFCPLC